MTRTECRVLFVENSSGGVVGGSHRSLNGLIRSLDPRFHSRAIFYSDNAMVERLRHAGVDVDVWDPPVRFRSRHDWRAAGSLVARILRCRRFLLHHRIDLVHFNNSPTRAFMDWLPASRLLGIPCISHSRGRGVEPPRTAAGQFLLRRFDRVVAVSQYARDAIVSAGVPAEQVEIVYNGIDADEFRAQVSRTAVEERAHLGIPADAFLVVMVGHLRSWKGQDVAIQSLRSVGPQLRPKIRLLLVGANESRGYQRAIEAAAEDGGLSDSVRFLGDRTDVPDLMNAADVVLHASTMPEPGARVLLEGMALGKPVVASRLGCAPEMLPPGHGALFDPAHPEELARLLDRLFTHPDWSRALGEAGRVRVKQFSLTANAAQTEAIYESVLAARGRHAR